jgi:RHS repeat-associated protein
MGNLTQTTAPLGRTTSSQYDANGNKISDTDANGHVTTYQYDPLNRLSVTTYPTVPPSTSTLTYDFRNNVVNAADQAGNVTHNDYDLPGRLIATTKAYGTANASRTTYTYYADGTKQTVTDPRGNTTTYTYDAAGRLITVTDAANNQTQYGYDDAGNRISITDANGHTTQFQYDCRKRLVKTIYADSTSTTYSYDNPGNLTGMTDQAGNTVQYTYDAANQLSSVIQVNHPNPAHNTTAYGYDNNGNLTAVTDDNGHSTATVFNVLNELTSTTLPDGALTQTRTYDLAGNLLTLDNFNGKTTAYAYDPLNRLLSKTPDPSLGEPIESFTYTATGKRLTMTDASGMTTYAYDSLDRLTSKATPQGTLSYTYDAAGNVASMTSSNPNGISVAYTYDQLNRLATVVDNNLTPGHNTTAYAYDPVSNLATATYPNGQQSTFSYDMLNRLTALNGYIYQLGPTGNRQSATEPSGRTANWSYDGIYRLTNETIANAPNSKNGAVSYALDPVGNRLSEASTLSGIPSGSWSYNTDDQLSTEQYDNNGNTVTSGARTFAYDFENRLKSMNTGAVMLVYDGDGNRVGKSTGAAAIRYLVDDLNPTGYAQVVEELVSGTVQRRYTYGVQRISQTQFLNSAWATSFYGYDGFGTVRSLTDSTGTVTDTYDYDAWGNAINVTGSTPNVYLYRGEQYDPDLKLYYLRARYFNPLTGRFLTRDPANGQTVDPRTLHKYLYAGGDPINYRDPSGRWGGTDVEVAGLLLMTAMVIVQIIAVVAPIMQDWCACVAILRFAVKLISWGTGWKDPGVPTWMWMPCVIFPLKWLTS